MTSIYNMTSISNISGTRPGVGVLNYGSTRLLTLWILREVTNLWYRAYFENQPNASKALGMQFFNLCLKCEAPLQLSIQSFGKLDLLRHQFEKHFKTGPFCFCWITRFMLFNDKFCSMRNERGRICKSKSVMMAELLIYSKNLKSVKSRTCFTLLNNKI